MRKKELAAEKKEIFERRQEKHDKRMHQFEEMLQLKRVPQDMHKKLKNSEKKKSKSKKSKYAEWNDEKPIVMPNNSMRVADKTIDGDANMHSGPIMDSDASLLSNTSQQQPLPLQPSSSTPFTESTSQTTTPAPQNNDVNNFHDPDIAETDSTSIGMTPTDDSAERNHPIASDELEPTPMQQDSSTGPQTTVSGNAEKGTGMLGPSAFSHFFVIFLSIFATAAGYHLHPCFTIYCIHQITFVCCTPGTLL